MTLTPDRAKTSHVSIVISIYDGVGDKLDLSLAQAKWLNEHLDEKTSTTGTVDGVYFDLTVPDLDERWQDYQIDTDDPSQTTLMIDQDTVQNILMESLPRDIATAEILTQHVNGTRSE